MFQFSVRLWESLSHGALWQSPGLPDPTSRKDQSWRIKKEGGLSPAKSYPPWLQTPPFVSPGSDGTREWVRYASYWKAVLFPGIYCGTHWSILNCYHLPGVAFKSNILLMFLFSSVWFTCVKSQMIKTCETMKRIKSGIMKVIVLQPKLSHESGRKGFKCNFLVRVTWTD